MEENLFGQFGISLLLGLLVGLQRERAESAIGGIRTFPLIAAFGTMSGWLALELGGWIVAAGFLALAALIVTSNFIQTRGGNQDAGQTSEIAALLLYGLGAYVVVGEPAVRRPRRRDRIAPTFQRAAARVRGEIGDRTSPRSCSSH